MRNPRQPYRRAGLGAFITAVAAFTIFIAVPSLHAADDDDFDSYKIRLDGFWFYSNPSGNIRGAGENGTIDINKDLSFNTARWWGRKRPFRPLE